MTTVINYYPEKESPSRRSRLYLGHPELVKFDPGRNDIADKDLEALQSNEGYKSRLAKGIFVIQQTVSTAELPETDGVLIDGQFDTLTKMTAKEAIKQVSNCNNVVALRRWLTDELAQDDPRRTVIGAIESKLTAID